jgi:hypothetical protein
MFLRRIERRKNGKTHLYWTIVENKRLDDGRVVQRHVYYLGEINSSQAEAWRKAIEVFDPDAGRSRTLSLFPEDRCEVADDASVVRLRLSEMRLHRPRQWGACWLAGLLWRDLQLDRFWAERLPASRKRTRWDHVLQVLVAYRLIEPGSEWRLHREWFGRSAMADLLGSDFGLAEAHKLYACHNLLLAHKDALFSHLTQRWRDLFNADFDVLLYDLTSTYFEGNAADLPEGTKRRHGYSRDKRPDCPQLVIALVVTPEGLPLAYEVLPGNTADSKTLRLFLKKIETQYGQARRVWVMDRGVPTEAALAEMRACDPPVQYLVGTPKGRLNRLEKHLIEKPWRKAREGVEVKLLAQDEELYVFAQSADRVAKERAMRRRQLKWLWTRLGKLAAMNVSYEEKLMKLGAARSKAPTAWRLVDVKTRQKERRADLLAQSPEAADRAASRRALSLAHQSDRPRPRRSLAVLRPTRRGRGGVQEPEGRSGYPSGLPQGRTAHRGARLRRLPRLRAAGHPDAPAARARAGTHSSQRAGKICRRPDDRRPPADHRWPTDRVDTLYQVLKSRTHGPNRGFQST